MRPIVFTVLFCALSAVYSPRLARAGTIYVNSAATGFNNGTTWYDAFTSLQDALTAARNTPGADTILIAGGAAGGTAAVYRPDIGTGITLHDRTKSFQIDSDMIVVGGYNPDGDGTLNVEYYKTVLSGDVDGNDQIPCETHTDCATITGACFAPTGFCVGDNSHHVFEFVPGGAGSFAQLSGVTIRGGFAPNGENGAGLKAGSGSIKVIDCRFEDNIATGHGGAVQNGVESGTSGSYVNCRFERNRSSGNGGAIFNGVNCELQMSVCHFELNEATGDGGAVYVFAGNSLYNNIYANCEFRTNTGGLGGGMYIVTNHLPEAPEAPVLTLTNFKFFGNTANKGGGGVYVAQTPIDFFNLTMIGNVAHSSPPGHIDGHGGGLWNQQDEILSGGDPSPVGDPNYYSYG